MLKNHIKIAFRNIWKNKVFSLINIIGLSIGLSSAFVIGLIVYYDLTFDKFHEDGNRIYRVVSDWTTQEGDAHNRGVAVPFGQAMNESITGVEVASTFFNTNISKVENNGSNVFRNINDVIYTDPSYFKLFKYKWLSGTPVGALSNPKEVVLTRSRAARYFPDENPEQILGKSLIYNDSVVVKVIGVIENFKQRSDLNFNEMLSVKTANYSHNKEQVFGENWSNTNSATQVFVKVIETNLVGNIERQLNRLSDIHENEELKSFGIKRTLGLQPLGDIHFNADYGIFNNSNSQASKTVLSGLVLVALFLLLLACINFVNFNTAQATRRAKEIGIRKTLGSSKKQLVLQFLGETFLLTLAAAALSVLFSSWLLRIFSDFLREGIDFTLFANALVILGLMILLGTVTLLSGFYPALVLSNFRPISVLKNQIFKGDNKTNLRKYLTVFQFVVAQIFIIATLLVGRQIGYVMNKDMGFKTEANVYVRTWHDSNINKRLNFLEEIKSIPQITEISLAGNPPASGNTNSTIATFLKDGNEINTDLHLLFGDLNYMKLYDIELLAGRERLNDTIKEYMVNETYTKIMGFQNPEEAVGQSIKISGEPFPIVGVMQDFNQRSLHSGIDPMALVGDAEKGRFAQYNTIHFSLDSQSSKLWPEVLTKVEKAWKAIYPEDEFELNFMDDTIKQFYEQERKTSVLLKWATGLAILISCLGLLGLVIHTTERRTKEIGIRKVLGASLAQLNFLLCKEFLILVGIAFVIAAPIAYWGLNNWLQDFAYKTELSWWIFLLSGIAMLLIALVIISIRTIGAANANPVKSLRNE